MLSHEWTDALLPLRSGALHLHHLDAPSLAGFPAAFLVREPDPFPTSLHLDRAANVLDIEWEDGSRSVLGGAALRWACPCAECRGEMGVPGRLDGVGDLPDDELSLDNAELIGQYAVQLGFRSGHATGIYTFPALRKLADAASQ